MVVQKLNCIVKEEVQLGYSKHGIPERCSEIMALYNHLSTSQQHGHTEHWDALKPWIHLPIYPCHFSCHAVFLIPNCMGHLAVLATEPNLYLTIPRGSQWKRWKGKCHYDFTKYSRPPFFPHPLSLVSEKNQGCLSYNNEIKIKPFIKNPVFIFFMSEGC